VTDAATTFTLIGGPTVLIAYGGMHILTDPTFDPPGEHPRPGTPVVLRKLAGPAMAPAELPPIDLVLLSHDHHADNLDPASRAFLPVPAVCSPRPLGRSGSATTPRSTWPAGSPPSTARSTSCCSSPAAALLDPAVVVPVHQEGWEHFSSPPGDLRRAFAAAGLDARLRTIEPGETLEL